MNFSEVLKALNSTSALELYRMRAAIERVLDEPRWVFAVQSRLQVGQPVEYSDPQSNLLRHGQVLELRRKQAVILDHGDGKRWLIPYVAINLDGVDVQIREQPKQGLGRNEVAIGEVVGFIDKHHQQRSGKVMRLNDKTVTLLVGRQQWRVSYGLLHHVVDSSAQDASLPDLAFIPDNDAN